MKNTLTFFLIFTGWSKCNNGYYMSGMFRNSCNNLYCIEEFRCCSMGPNNGKSFAENPKISVRIRGTDGKLKECSMDAIDRSASTSSYKCKSITDTTNGMYLEAREFKVEDKVGFIWYLTPFCGTFPSYNHHHMNHMLTGVGFNCGTITQ